MPYEEQVHFSSKIFLGGRSIEQLKTHWQTSRELSGEAH